MIAANGSEVGNVTQESPQKSRRVLRLPQVIERTGLGRDSVYRLGNDEESGFPKPIKLSERASGWLESEVDAWLEKRVAARDAQKVTDQPAA